jgi:hypothetical protein
MLAAIPIATTLLAVLDDDDDRGVDLIELFQRAVMFENSSIFWNAWDRLPREDQDRTFDGLVRYALDLYADLPVKERWPWANSKNADLQAICRVINRKDENHDWELSIVDRVASQISNRLKQATSLRDLKRMISEEKTVNEVNAGHLLVNIHNTRSYNLADSFEFWPTSKGRDRFRILLPVWNRGDIQGHTVRCGLGVMQLWSWDENEVLLVGGRRIRDFQMSSCIEDRSDVGL